MALHIGFGIKGATQDAPDYRLGAAGLVARSSAGVPRAGVFPAGTGALVSSRSDMTVNIAAFVAVLTRGASYGTVNVSNDGTMQSPTFDAAPASNSRIDVLWLRQNDSVHAADADNLPTWGIAKGTAAGSPTAPSVPSGALAFAQVLIPAGATATNSVGVTITDVYPYTAATGGTVLLRSQAEQDAWTPADGALAFRLDTGVLIRRVSGAWSSGSGATSPGSVVPTAGSGFTLSSNNLFERDGWLMGTIVWTRTSGTLSHADVILTMPVGYGPLFDMPVGGSMGPSPFEAGTTGLFRTATRDVQALSPSSGRTNGTLSFCAPIAT